MPGRQSNRDRTGLGQRNGRVREERPGIELNIDAVASVYESETRIAEAVAELKGQRGGSCLAGSVLSISTPLLASGLEHDCRFPE